MYWKCENGFLIRLKYVRGLAPMMNVDGLEIRLTI